MANSKSAYSFAGKKQKLDTHIIVVWVDNEAGVLARVVGLFSGRGYNIESLAVAEVDQSLNISRITIVTTGTPQVVDQIKLNRGPPDSVNHTWQVFGTMDFFFKVLCDTCPKNKLGLFKTLHFHFELVIECIAGFLLLLWILSLLTTLKNET